MNYYEQIKNKLIDNEVYQKAKDYSKEKNTLITYMRSVNFFLWLGAFIEKI